MKQLGERAGVSERFLAQLETGEGNISVARLEDVAEALATTAAKLLSDAGSRPRREAGKSGSKDECLQFVREVWTDMRPLSIRKGT